MIIGARSIADPVQIVAPNVANDHMKATKAIGKYMDSSKETTSAWNDVVDSKKTARPKMM